MNLCQSTFSSLYCRYTIFCVCRSLIQTTDLLSHLLRNCQTCCIICCTVDSVTRRKFLCRLRKRICCHAKHSVSVHRCNIVLYYHSSYLLVINVRGESFRPGVNMFRYSMNGVNHLEISRITCCFAVASFLFKQKQLFTKCCIFYYNNNIG